MKTQKQNSNSIIHLAIAQIEKQYNCEIDFYIPTLEYKLKAFEEDIEKIQNEMDLIINKLRDPSSSIDIIDEICIIIGEKYNCRIEVKLTDKIWIYVHDQPNHKIQIAIANEFQQYMKDLQLN